MQDEAAKRANLMIWSSTNFPKRELLLFLGVAAFPGKAKQLHTNRIKHLISRGQG